MLQKSAQRVASRYLNGGNSPSLVGIPRNKVVALVQKAFERAKLNGFFHDEYWQPIHRIWKQLEELGIPYGVTKSEYEHDMVDGKRVPVRKVWLFEVPFTTPKGTAGTVIGRVTAAGNGPVKDPLQSYDVTAYAT